jgi:phosphoribosylaminoimidazole-succinocarboxamide synthase
MIVADTKFEFGLVDGSLMLIDEVLTPDSSRFWDAAAYQPGRPQTSFDKQPVRDYLAALGWRGEAPAPPLPPEIVVATVERYRTAFRRLTGREIDA